MLKSATRAVALAALVLGLPRVLAFCAERYFPEAVPDWLSPLVFGSAPVQNSALQFQPLSHDFGVVLEGDVIEYLFEYENTSSRPVSIVKAIKSCGCSKTEYSKDPIPAGGRGTVRFVLETDNKTGPQTKKLTLKTDESDDSRVVLLLRGRIESPLLVRGLPATGTLAHQGKPGDEFEDRLEVGVAAGTENLELIRADHPAFTAALEGSGATRQLVVRSVAPSQPGTIESTLVLQARQTAHTELPERWEKRIRVALTVPAAYNAIPKVLKLREGKGKVNVSNQWGDRLEFLGAECSTPLLTVRDVSREGSSVHTYEVELRASGEAVPQGACLRIQTSLPGVGVIEIPVEGPAP